MGTIRAWRTDEAERSTETVDAAELRDQLEQLATRVSRLNLSWRDPAQFAVERSEIAHQLRRLARAAR
jgi:hypothetical protein